LAVGFCFWGVKKNKLKKLLRKYFSNLAFFFGYLRYSLLWLALLSTFVGLVDGIGLTLFVPLLETATNGEAAGNNMGQLSIITDFLSQIGLRLTVNNVIMLMIGIFIFKGYLKYSESYYKAKLRLKFISKMRYQMIRGMTNMRYIDFVDSDAGKIQNILSGEVGRVAAAFQQYLLTIQSGVMLLIYLILAFFANPEFAILVIIGGLLMNLIYRVLYKITKKLSKEVSSQGHGFQGYLIQIVHYFKYLKATGALKQFQRRLFDKVDGIEAATLKMGRLGAVLIGSREAISVTIVMVVILIQINFFGGTITALILSLLFFHRSLGMVMQIQNSWNSFLSVAGALDSTQEFLSDLNATKEIQGPNQVDENSSGYFFKGVSFSYKSGKKVLDNINLNITPNETVAFVGESGSGKTTLVNLIAGLFDNYDGAISVGKQDYKLLTKESLQRRIGYITQEPVIFNDTIFNNVTLWDEKNDETLEKFNNALIKAAIFDFVAELPKAENAELGNNGINLSGGQKQRISIARELYKNVDTLILDEATAALDSETERMIQENIEHLKGKYTIIIIAHRLSTIKNADRIFLIKQGNIDAEGSFYQLVNRSESFARMVQLQDFK